MYWKKIHPSAHPTRHPARHPSVYNFLRTRLSKSDFILCIPPFSTNPLSVHIPYLSLPGSKNRIFFLLKKKVIIIISLLHSGCQSPTSNYTPSMREATKSYISAKIFLTLFLCFSLGWWQICKLQVVFQTSASFFTDFRKYH